MLDSSANQMWSFGGDAVKRTHAGTADFESASPRTKYHYSREERANHFLTYNCKAF
jgi:hypothetical protein